MQEYLHKLWSHAAPLLQRVFGNCSCVVLRLDHEVARLVRTCCKSSASCRIWPESQLGSRRQRVWSSDTWSRYSLHSICNGSQLCRYEGCAMQNGRWGSHPPSMTANTNRPTKNTALTSTAAGSVFSFSTAAPAPKSRKSNLYGRSFTL